MPRNKWKITRTPVIWTCMHIWMADSAKLEEKNSRIILFYKKNHWQIFNTKEDTITSNSNLTAKSVVFGRAIQRGLCFSPLFSMPQAISRYSDSSGSKVDKSWLIPPLASILNLDTFFSNPTFGCKNQKFTDLRKIVGYVKIGKNKECQHCWVLLLAAGSNSAKLCIVSCGCTLSLSGKNACCY